MGRLGCQSDAQATLAVSYNGLEGYANSLHEALTQALPGLRGSWASATRAAVTTSWAPACCRLKTSSTAPSAQAPCARGERPLHALRERGVEICGSAPEWTSTPSIPWASQRPSHALLDVFLLHCLLSDSPPDNPAEIAELAANQHLTAERGREPGLLLQRQGQAVAFYPMG